MSFERFEDIPPHVTAAMSAPERAYYEQVLNAPHHFGNGWITAHRTLEARMGDTETRWVIGCYFGDEAMKTLTGFVTRHWSSGPTTGRYSESTVSDRVRTHYPSLFSNLRCRVQPLFEIPALATYRARFEAIEAAFYEDLTAAETLARRLDQNTKVKRLHDDYRLAFANIREELRDLLADLVAFGEGLRSRAD